MCGIIIKSIDIEGRRIVQLLKILKFKYNKGETIMTKQPTKKKAVSDKTILDGFDKRQAQREKKSDTIANRLFDLVSQSQKASEAGDLETVKRLQPQIQKCHREIAMIDVNEAEDRLSYEKAEMRRIEAGIKSKFTDAEEKTDLSNLAVLQDDLIFNAEEEVKRARAYLKEISPQKPAKKKSMVKMLAAKTAKSATARGQKGSGRT